MTRRAGSINSNSTVSKVSKMGEGGARRILDSVKGVPEDQEPADRHISHTVSNGPNRLVTNELSN